MMPESKQTDETRAGSGRAEKLLRAVRELVVELQPRRAATLRITLDSRLEQDLGLDSLARGELLFRLQRDFKCHLPDTVLGEAETVRDLLDAVEKAGPGRPETARAKVEDLTLGPVGDVPVDAGTLIDVLDWHAHRHPDRKHIFLWQEYGEVQPLTYRDLRDGAARIAAGLAARGIGPGRQVGIMLPTGADFFLSFMGVLYTGAVPVPIYPPMRRSALEDHMRRQAKILNNADATLLIGFEDVKPLAALLKSLVDSLTHLETPDGLRSVRGSFSPAPLPADATALIQYTSGSTGDPKGVVLSHANLLANIRAMGSVMKASSEDVFVSWLPLYHDMGLIGAWLGSLYYAAPLAIMSPLSFLARPDRWLWAIHRYRGTLSAAPNFAFELCARRIDDADIEGLDLSSLRMVTNGAEPVNAQTIERFTARFSPYGFHPDALAPVYGLAENSVGLAFPPPGRPPLIQAFDRETLARRGVAEPAADDAEGAVRLVSCGMPLPGHEIRIIDAAGHEAAERAEGRLQFRGPSATAGYFNTPEKTRDLFDGDWRETGDLAFIDGGELYITDRIKDVIIRAGRNIHPHEVEAAVGDLAGIRKGCVVVFGMTDPALGTEKLVILAETRETDPETRRRLHDAIADTAAALIAGPPDDIVLLPPRSVPKTSSGKIRRSAARDLYARGGAGAPRRPLWWQWLRLMISAGAQRLRTSMRTMQSTFYAGYFWAVIALLGLMIWPLVVSLPRLRWRWTVFRGFAKTALWLTGLHVDTEGAPASDAGILVTNHASYLDGLVLTAVLPRPVVFVAKKDLARQVVAGPFLKRLDVLFVERTAATGGLANTEEAVAAVRADRTLVFFAEGTLTRMPGLLPFRLGAFIVAARTGSQVVPVTISGTRSVLRGGGWFPRRGRIAVRFAEPIAPDGGDFDAAVRLRDKARTEILKRLGEPDLAGEHVVFTDKGIERTPLGL